MNKEKKISIDGVEYALDNLSPEGQKSLNMLRVAELEIQHLQAQLAIAQTARMVYLKTLKAALNRPAGETLPVSSLAVSS